MRNNCNRCILYHGSEFEIQTPVFGEGKVYNDYGLGFYCTKELDMAMEWAVGESHDGFANRYEFDLKGLKIIDLSARGYTVLHWLSVLLENRVFDLRGDVISAARAYLKENFSVDYADADVMIGYRADDNYFSFARAFLNGALSYERLCRAIRLGGLGLQFVLKSRKAFERIRFLSAEPADRAAYLAWRQRREESARADYARIVAEPFDPKALYMTNILQGVAVDRVDSFTSGRETASPLSAGDRAGKRSPDRLSEKGSVDHTSCLEDAMELLGAMLEDAVMLFKVPVERFWPLFLASPVAERFAAGDPFVVAGQSGWELAVRVLEEAGVSFPKVRPTELRSRTPEYWAGWALAQYQWYRGFTFPEIESFAPIGSVIGLYAPFHEMDITRFYDEMDARYRAAHPETRLREFRERAGLTRDQLAARAQVSSRLIEQYEQRRRDINAARADTFLALAGALRCPPRELLERVG